MEENKTQDMGEEQKEKVVQNESEEKIPKEFSEILEEVPEEARHEVKRMIGMSMQMGGIVSPQLELMKKMTPEHVSEFLQGQREASNNEFKESRDNKFFLSFVLIVVLGFIMGLIVILKDKPDIMEKVLYAVGGLTTGLVGGYGYGKSKNDN